MKSGQEQEGWVLYVLDRMFWLSYLSLPQPYSALHSLTQCFLFQIYVLTFERFPIDLWRACYFEALVYALVPNHCRHLQQYLHSWQFRIQFSPEVVQVSTELFNNEDMTSWSSLLSLVVKVPYLRHNHPKR